MKTILGSASKSRRRILEEKKVVFEVMSADIDERAIRDSDPQKLVLKLAHAKADALIPRITEEALLITSDQVVVCNDDILEKPLDADEERAMLRMYARYPAETVTSVVIANTQTGERAEGVDRAKVWFRPFPDEFIEQMVAYPRVYELGGGFSIGDPLFLPYVERIEGERESVIGLPWAMTQKMLLQLSATFIKQ